MKHLKLTVVGLLALASAASDAFAFGPPGPPMGGPPHLPMGGAPPFGGGLPRLPMGGGGHPVPREIPSGMSRRAPQEISPGTSRHAAPREMSPAPGMSRQAP
jgi:hypothetical protein